MAKSVTGSTLYRITYDKEYSGNFMANKGGI